MIGKWVRTEFGGYDCPNCNHTIYCCSLRNEPFSLPNYCPKCGQNMKEETMRVTYNGFTGELMKLEREIGMMGITDDGLVHFGVRYTLTIYDSKKKVTHSFNGVKLEDVKFIGIEVALGG